MILNSNVWVESDLGHTRARVRDKTLAGLDQLRTGKLDCVSILDPRGLEQASRGLCISLAPPRWSKKKREANRIMGLLIHRRSSELDKLVSGCTNSCVL